MAKGGLPPRAKDGPGEGLVLVETSMNPPPAPELPNPPPFPLSCNIALYYKHWSS